MPSKSVKKLIPCLSTPWSIFPEKEISVDLLDAYERDRPPHQQYVQKSCNFRKREICLQVTNGLGDLTEMVCSTGYTRCFQARTGKENSALI